jgi:hypothetical protein
MRALCGAIITAGAFIGLGLCALGIGNRYNREQLPKTDKHGKEVRVPFMYFTEMDDGLQFCVVMCTIGACIGLGIAFVGLAYHHHRRHHEHLRYTQGLAGSATAASAPHSGLG